MPLAILMIWMTLEMFVFILVACLAGFGPALLLCVLSACAGIGLLRLQGRALWQTVRDSAPNLQGANFGQAMRLSDNLAIGLAGLLLIVPGFLSDLAALALLIPRAGRLWRGRRSTPESGVIEGDYEKIDDGRIH